MFRKWKQQVSHDSLLFKDKNPVISSSYTVDEELQYSYLHQQGEDKKFPGTLALARKIYAIIARVLQVKLNNFQNMQFVLIVWN